jgi:ribonuclease HII
MRKEPFLDEALFGKWDYIIGVDEAGRGPLAGPVSVGGTLLDVTKLREIREIEEFLWLDDSKKMTQIRRDKVYEIFLPMVDHAHTFVDEGLIDSINILEATKLGMQEVVEDLLLLVDSTAQSKILVLIDGNFGLEELCVSQKSVIQGDSKYACIAMASVIAKVSRDRLMNQKALEYPQYGFEKHKGYGTRMHMEKIRELGLSSIHRKSFCKKFEFIKKVV